MSNINYQVKIIANGGLNIRAGASVNYNRVGGYTKNSIVTILAESNGWGKTDKGWISLVYTSRYTAAAKMQQFKNIQQVHIRLIVVN